MATTRKMGVKQLNTWELLIIFIGFISIVCLIISIYAAHLKEKFYPWGPVAYGGPWGGPASGGPASGGPWNIPTRYPIRGWGWDIRGYPAAYPIDYGLYGYPGGQPAYPAPEPDSTNLNTKLGSSNSKSQSASGNAAPFGIEMTQKTTKLAKPTNNKPSTATPAKSTNNQIAQEAQDEKAAEEWIAKESKWWPDWVSWPWMPYFNYGLHYDVNGKLKPSDNESIPANHAWSGSWWYRSD